MNELVPVYPGVSNPAEPLQANLELIANRLYDIATETSDTTITLDFADQSKRTIALSDDLALDASHMADGREMWIRIVDSGSGQTITPNVSWIWVGSAAPSAIAAGKTMLIHLICYGTAASDIVARYWVEP